MSTQKVPLSKNMNFAVTPLVLTPFVPFPSLQDVSIGRAARREVDGIVWGYTSRVVARARGPLRWHLLRSARGSMVVVVVITIVINGMIILPLSSIVSRSSLCSGAHRVLIISLPIVALKRINITIDPRANNLPSVKRTARELATVFT